MGLLEDIKAKIDQNGDGKIDTKDLEALKTGENADVINKLKEKADQNGDGKLSFDDVKSIDFGAIGDKIGGVVGDLKDKLFGGDKK